MERTTTNSLVPFQPFQLGRMKLRHTLILSSRASRATTTAFSSPYTQNNISYFGGMYMCRVGLFGVVLYFGVST